MGFMGLWDWDQWIERNKHISEWEIPRDCRKHYWHMITVFQLSTVHPKRKLHPDPVQISKVYIGDS
jgi:hypothetical protein